MGVGREVSSLEVGALMDIVSPQTSNRNDPFIINNIKQRIAPHAV